MPPVELQLRDSTRKLKFLYAGNIISFLLVVITQKYFLALNYDEIIKKHPTFFNPSTIFTDIFSFVFYALLFCFVLYAQFSRNYIVQQLVEHAIGSLFIISNLLNFCWAASWLMEEFILSEIFTLLNFIVTSKIHNNIIVDFPPSSLPSLQATVIVFCIHTPFSMYDAITCSNVFYNGFIAFTDMNDQYFIVASIFAWFLAVIGLAWAITGIMSKGRRDGVFSATIAWELLAIAVQQREFEFLSLQCFVLALVIIVTIIAVWIRLGGELTEVIGQHNITITSEQHDPLLQQENGEE
ncbi:hypothetical protein Glove_332g37 [Diversispora epigaea]|uniref:Uncharacterized protein n=1 Tax=Diversispora epigaea TaxID=1348612 RepID=A0A397HNI0_9GLOM|nr:hypothetical protein Glove_332g37 [Diversispora epigaea]